MSASQFTIYSSSDPGNGSDQPGLIFGAAGDLLRILDKCLVNGYTGKAAAGWTKPFANSSNSGCYKQNGGAGFALHIQDNGPNVTSTFKEAWATGWENITAVNATVGAGTGQFPTAAQALTTGHVVFRKSTTADSTNGRQWVLFADATTFYIFFLTGDTAGQYFMGGFGDIYSLKGSSDSYRCIILGRLLENSVTALASDWDVLNGGVATTGTNLKWMARSFGGGGSSISVAVVGDGSRASTTWAYNTGTNACIGTVQTPNGTDNSFYLSPLVISEPGTGTVRGRLRGTYQVCHPLASFVDGQTFQGSGDYAGKTFIIVSKGPNSGYWAVETGATVETN